MLTKPPSRGIAYVVDQGVKPPKAPAFWYFQNTSRLGNKECVIFSVQLNLIFTVYSMLNCWHVINQCTTTSRSIIPDIIAKNAFPVVSIFRMFSFFRDQDIFFSNQANLILFLMVWSVSFTIDSSFFSKVFILNYVWEKLSSRSSLTTDTFQVIPLISILICISGSIK